MQTTVNIIIENKHKQIENKGEEKKPGRKAIFLYPCDQNSRSNPTYINLVIQKMRAFKSLTTALHK